MGRKFGLVLAITVVTVTAWGAVRAPVVLAGTCSTPCLGTGGANGVNATEPASVDSTTASQVLQGTRNWSFDIINSYPGSGTATNVTISATSGYPASSFQGVSGFPVTTSTATLAPNGQMSLGLNSTIPVSFNTGFDSARSMSPEVIPPGGAQQSVRVAFTAIDPSKCNPGGCQQMKGDLETRLGGASVVSVVGPSNLNQGEAFNSSSQPPGAQWGLIGIIPGKRYTLTVTISLPDLGHAYDYKPLVGLGWGGGGPSGCQVDPCPGPTKSTTVAAPTLDGGVPGAGQVTFSADQPFTWDEGGPQPGWFVNYSGLAVGAGYWQVAADGGMFPFGAVGGFGSTGNVKLNQPMVGMAATADRRGYWLVASDGGIFPFGDAGGYGSTGNVRLNKPIVGMAATPDGRGYWLVASDGGVFPFGDAGRYGSTGNVRLNKPIVGMAATPDGGGYWLVASDGGVFPFGDAGGFGSTGSVNLNKPIVGMAAAPGGAGYWLVASDGGIFPFGPSAGGFGSTGNIRLNQPIVGMAATPDGMGYWLVAADGGIFPFGNAAGFGSLGSTNLNQPIVGIAAA